MQDLGIKGVCSSKENWKSFNQNKLKKFKAPFRGPSKSQSEDPVNSFKFHTQRFVTLQEYAYDILQTLFHK